MECPPGPGHFVVFTAEGKDYVVETPEAAGVYRWTHAFRAADRPLTYEVRATPYLMRGKCDWVYNNITESWDCYPGSTNKPDLQVGDERVIRITCYPENKR
jgi:hypothetical protein